MLKRLRLINFRRYPKLELHFDDKLNVIEGENNAGKTTIFMAIEYVLFGTVSGFRSQVELASPDADEVGAELIYNGIDGKTYKLQRIHLVGGRGKRKGAVGFYTLKEIEADGEKYILSSDFENNPEEMLQLKIYETFGISKRLFNIAINVKQGEISEILQGKSDLDIVLGVSASKIAEKSVRQIALGYEKETSQYDNLRKSKDTISNEKIQLEKQKLQLDRQKSEISDTINSLQAQLNNFDQLKEIVERFQNTFDDVYEVGEEWQSEVSNYRSLFKNHSKLIETSLSTYETRLNELTEEDAKTQQEITATYVKDDDINEQLQQFNQQLGDIQGKLNRRKKISGIAKCEVCGADIDSTRVEKEIGEWETEKTQIDAQITVLNVQLSQNKTQTNLLRSKISNISNEIQKIKLTIEQIKQSEGVLNRKIPDLQALGLAFENKYKELQKSRIEYETLVKGWIEKNNAEGDLQDNLLLSRWDKSEEKTVKYHTLEISGELISSYLDLNEYNDKLSSIQETKIKLSASLEAKLSVEQSRLKDLEIMSREVDPRIKRLEKQISGLEEELRKLTKKRNAALKLRQLSSGFKKLTTTLRNQSAKQLAELTWKYHKQLSGSDEYHALSIDPTNYALLIRPKDIDEEVPAYYYQGGGHKLLLGLAYKFAISNLVTKPSYYLLDEPTYGLDNENKEKLLKNIQELTQTVQVNMITHQREDLTLDGKLIRVVKDERNSRLEVIS